VNEDKLAMEDYFNPDNFMKVFDAVGQLLQDYKAENGWSDEILIPRGFDIFEMELLTKPSLP